MSRSLTAYHLKYMFELLLPITAIIFGIAVLVWSADKFVEGAASLALNYGLSPMIIGLTIVSIGTSAPEMIVSATAALNNAPGLAIGNAIGSNIANIALVLGATALISAIPIKTGLLKREFPFLILITLVTGYMLSDFQLTQIEAFILMLGILPFIWLVFKFPGDHDGEVEEDSIHKLTTQMSYFWLTLGFALLLISSKFLVWGATEVATFFGVSELIIGLTIVAIGTSLPELAASVTSALKGHHDIALGNIIGSNIFNLLGVVGIAGVFGTFSFETDAFYRDFFIMAGLTLLLALRIYIKPSKPFGQWLGLLFLASYGIYLLFLYYDSL